MENKARKVAVSITDRLTQRYNFSYLAVEIDEVIDFITRLILNELGDTWVVEEHKDTNFAGANIRDEMGALIINMNADGPIGFLNAAAELKCLLYEEIEIIGKESEERLLKEKELIERVGKLKDSFIKF